SYKLFRRDASSADWAFIGYRLLPLLTVALVCGASIFAARFFLYGPHSQEGRVMNEVHDIVVQSYIDGGRLDPSHPVRLTPEDVAQLPGVSAVTRAWVRDTTMTVFPMERAAATYLNVPGSKLPSYYVTVLYPSGRECRTAGRNWWCIEPANQPKRISG